MPACTTPELCPVWWAATRSSFSSTTTRLPGRRRVSSRAIASPTMPAPTTPITSSAMGVGISPAPGGERLVHLEQQFAAGERLLQEGDVRVQHPGGAEQPVAVAGHVDH